MRATAGLPPTLPMKQTSTGLSIPAAPRMMPSATFMLSMLSRDVKMTMAASIDASSITARTHASYWASRADAIMSTG